MAVTAAKEMVGDFESQSLSIDIVFLLPINSLQNP
jgi:hypothetical protein